MITRIFYIVLFLLISTIGWNQSQSQYISAGEKSMEEGDFYGASIYFGEAMLYDSTDLDLIFKYAESFRLHNNYEKAEYYYNKIYYKDGGREYKKAVFWLASMQKINGKYLESYKTWKHVKTLFPRSNTYENQKAKQEIKASAFARRAEKYRNNAKVLNVGEGVNTVESEFNPWVHNQKLYFSSQRAKNINPNGEVLDEIYKVKVYEALVKDSAWELENDLPFIINSPQYHNANACFSPDGTQFYFTRCIDNSSCEIMVSSFLDGKWKAPKSLSINTTGKNTQPMSCIINGEEYLFFASDRKGGFGKLDIWYTKKKQNGEFEKPENGGKQINTPDNEITPFYDSESGSLFFSSEWHAGLGGFDIFQSFGIPERLGKPKNVGAPINSRWNDMYYFVDTVTDSNYMASNREGSMTDKNATCCNDIYSVAFPEKIVPEEIVIETLEDLNKYLPVTLYFHNDCPNPRTTATTTTLNYTATYKDYIQLLPTYNAEYSRGLSGLKKEEAILDIDDFFKEYVEKGVDDLELFTQLLWLELQKGTEVELTVKGFASPLAKTDYNVKLTGRRISSLQNYLKEYENGKFLPYINSSKLTFKEVPFGEYTASTLVSDNVNDQRNSVYSRAAALERKIEIISVNYLNEKQPRIGLNKESIDLGSIKKGTKIPVSFTVTNNGNAPLILEKIEGSCSCSVVNTSQVPLQPGESRVVNATIDTEQLSGKQTKVIQITSNSNPAQTEFVVNFEVTEN